MNQSAVLISDCRNDPRNQIVLQLENSLRTKTAFIVLGPQMSAGRCVYELDREAQLRPRLSQAAFHQVACAERLANRLHLTRITVIVQGRIACDDAQVGEARQPCHYVLRQTFGQGCEISVAARVFKWQYRDPETFVHRRWAWRRSIRRGGWPPCVLKSRLAL